MAEIDAGSKNRFDIGETMVKLAVAVLNDEDAEVQGALISSFASTLGLPDDENTSGTAYKIAFAICDYAKNCVTPLVESTDSASRELLTQRLAEGFAADQTGWEETMESIWLDAGEI
jgi:hypothetical protein